MPEIERLREAAGNAHLEYCVQNGRNPMSKLKNTTVELILDSIKFVAVFLTLGLMVAVLVKLDQTPQDVENLPPTTLQDSLARLPVSLKDSLCDVGAEGYYRCREFSEGNCITWVRYLCTTKQR